MVVSECGVVANGNDPMNAISLLLGHEQAIIGVLE
jgi:hypothetical protein